MTDQPHPGDPNRADGADGPDETGQTSQYRGYDPFGETTQYPGYGRPSPYPSPSPYSSPSPYPTQQYPQPQDGQYPQYSRYDGQQYDQHPYGQQYGQPFQQPQYPQYGQPYGYPQPVPPPPPRQPSTARSLIVGFGAALAATALVLVGVALTGNDDRADEQPGAFDQPSVPVQPVQPSTPGGSVAPGSAQRSGPASDTQQIGIVTIVSTLKYQNAQSAGTGMIMSSDGQVLTNNHVIRGSTSIRVTVESTGRVYSAKVVGTAPTSDVAVIKMSDASGLTPANFAVDAGDVKVGDAVTGVGNGGGTGKLTAAPGRVTALNQSITASDEDGRQSERLRGLIEVNAKIISGDSGGPLYDADTEIIGMNTAASSARARTPSAYAITVEDAMALADQIESGVETTEIRIGYPGFLGVTTRPAANQGGAQVADVIDGLPADDAGITRGSIITSADGVTVRSAAQLTEALQGRDPGNQVDITWTTPSGDSQSATVTLTTGPAD